MLGERVCIRAFFETVLGRAWQVVADALPRVEGTERVLKGGEKVYKGSERVSRAHLPRYGKGVSRVVAHDLLTS